MSTTETKPTRKAFEELLRTNGYPKRLIVKLSARWQELLADDPDQQDVLDDADAEAIAQSLRDLAARLTSM